MKATQVQATGKSCYVLMADCEKIGHKQEQEAKQARLASPEAIRALQAKVNGQYHKQ